ncbi:MAG: hypothetical protein ABIK37_07380 [candidate division WOR-3 bacterium]
MAKIVVVTASCALCSAHKARRECPALAQTICSECCGRKRRRSIDCPDECPYFIAGARAGLVRLARTSGRPEFEQEWYDVLHNLRRALLSGARALTDEESRTAFQNAAGTLRTRSKGLIYEFRSADPRVQSAVEEILEVAQAHEQGKHGLRRVSLAELAACLAHLERTVEAFMKQAPGENRFVEVAVQTVGHRMVAENRAGASPDETGTGVRASE